MSNEATLLSLEGQAGGFPRYTAVAYYDSAHRGQLTVYLRLNDAPVPAIYGPSADENPFVPK